MTDLNAPERASAALQKKIGELTALNKLARAATESLDPNEVINAVLAEIIPLLNPDLAMFFLTEGGKFVLAGFAYSGEQGDRSEMPCHKIGEYLCGLAASAGRAFYSPDIQTDERCALPAGQTAEIRSVATLPFFDHGLVIGFLVLASREIRNFEQEQTFLQALTGQISPGLKNALQHRNLLLQLEQQRSFVQDQESLIDALAKKGSSWNRVGHFRSD